MRSVRDSLGSTPSQRVRGARADGAAVDVQHVIHSSRLGPQRLVIGMLTIFSIPKPFLGHIGVIQRNAVRSWLALRPHCEVILLGDEEGTASCAQELGVRHLPGIARNEYGTPLLNDAFERVADAGRFPRLCYVNADIILPAAFTRSVERVTLPRFLMVGQRVTIDVDAELDFADPDCRRALAARLESGSLDAPYGSDYFVFPKGALGPLPPFAVGRPGWDNWMIFRAEQLHVPVVDASECVLVVHQSHAYMHVPGHSGDQWEGPEADTNRGMMSTAAQRFTTGHATWRLAADGLFKRHWWSHDHAEVLEAAGGLHPWALPFLSTANVLLRRWDRRAARWLVSIGRKNSKADEG